MGDNPNHCQLDHPQGEPGEQHDDAAEKGDGPLSPRPTKKEEIERPDIEVPQEVYSIFTRRQKGLIVAVVAIAGFFRSVFHRLYRVLTIGSPPSPIHTALSRRICELL
jgi:hypothetical protein